MNVGITNWKEYFPSLGHRETNFNACDHVLFYTKMNGLYILNAYYK